MSFMDDTFQLETDTQCFSLIIFDTHSDVSNPSEQNIPSSFGIETGA